MSRKGVVALASALSVLIAAIFFFYIRADVWFSVEEALRPATPLRLEEVSLEKTQRLSMDELAARKDVRVSATMMLVNASHPLPEGYDAELEEYNGAQMHPLMVDSYIAMRDRVLELTDVRIYVSSDYRTRKEQEEILASSPEGVAAGVGCSEHEAGLALDLYAPYYAGESFLRSSAGRSVNRICADYGFVIRYPKGKEAVTGISYEPWHVRYVGAPHARLMHASRLTLEEYVEALPPERMLRAGDYLILRTAMEEISMPLSWEECVISPDNTGYWIVTVKIS